MPENLDAQPSVSRQIEALSEKLRVYPWTIAVDGPAAAGKGTLVDRLTGKFAMRRIETGKGYRGVTWYFLYEGISDIDALSDEEIAQRLTGVSIQFETAANGEKRVTIYRPSEEGTIDITNDLEDPQIGVYVSRVAKRAPVRDFLEKEQRAMLAGGRVVIEGRDMWQVVGDTADVLVYVFANNQTLVVREIERQRQRGVNLSSHQAQNIVIERNKQDNLRARGKLLTPQEARDCGLYDAVIDTSHLTPDEVFLTVLQVMARKYAEMSK